MKNKIWLLIVVLAVLLSGVAWVRFGQKAPDEGVVNVIHPDKADIQRTVSTTATIMPKNRLEVTPPVNGRMEQVHVKEGQQVKAGDIVATMSSTDRAALLDAARGQGADTLKYWQEVYKPIPLSAPIDGQVIVGTVQPGQAVITSDAVIVISDQLIVRAQVDETDIGKVKVGQEAVVSLDAYADAKIKAVVDHIYYESKTVNNVTVYLVDLKPEAVPDFFRSGMNANVELILESREQVLTLPLSAVQKDNGTSFVMVNSSGSDEPVLRLVVTGMADDKKVEIVSGLTEDDEVVTKAKKYTLPKSAAGKNPFAPTRPKRAAR